MGNQIYGMTSPQVIGCEECLHELQNWFHFEEELRGSRLFKVAKVKCVGGKWSSRKVVKIFPYSKATFSIENAKKSVLPFCKRIEGAVNLLPLSTEFISDKFAFIIRDFVDHSLTERLVTRPFLTLDEKRWISFQLLSAVNQLHSSISSDSTSRCHGDIKSENVLLTAWGWLLLADPAPFKPTRLPADNPSGFTYFFDSSRRRVCYLAPERFTDPVLSSSGGGDAEALSSAMGFLNLRDDTILGSEEEEEITLGEVVGEDMLACNEDATLPPTHTGIQIASPTGTSVGDNEGPLGDANEGARPIGRFSTISGSCPVSAPSTPVLVEERIASLTDRLRPSMDLFSVGCVLLEMFANGSVAFTLSDLLAYRRHENGRIIKLLDSVPDPSLQSLIRDLLSLHPEARGSAAHHLLNHRGGLFPDFFFTNLHPFMQSFLEPFMASPDGRIRRIRENLPILISNLLDEPPSAQSAGSVVLCNLITATLHLQYFNKANPTTAAFVDKTYTTTTSQVPSEDAEMDALFCLLLLTKRLPSLCLFNRLWPHFVELISHPRLHSSEVRCLAMEGLVQSLESAAALAMSGHGKKREDFEEEDCVVVLSDTRFLNEFLLPSLSPLAQDPCAEVRIVLAQCLPRLGVVCSKLLELARLRIMKKGEERSLDENLSDHNALLVDVDIALRLMDAALPTRGVNAGVEAARSLLRDRLVNLFTDDTADNSVRRTIMQTTTELAALATFLGSARANDVILSHMLTFLNDKKEANLRTAFFNQVAPMVGFFGAQSVAVLRALLEQGLSDPHENVLAACLRALAHLQRRHLLGAPVSIAFLHRVLNLTAHPAAYIRQACIAFVTAFARVGMKASSAACQGPLDDRSIETADGSATTKGPHTISADLDRFVVGTYGFATVYAHLASKEVNETIFAHPIGSNFTADAVLLSALQPCLSYAFLQGVIATLFDVAAAVHTKDPSAPPASPRQLCSELIEHLKERQDARQVTRKGETPWYPSPSSDAVSEVLDRLRLRGMTDLMENQLLRLSTLLMNLSWNVAEPGSRSASTSLTSRGPNQLVCVVSPSSEEDLPRVQLYPLPIKTSGVVWMRRPQSLTLSSSNPEVNEPPPEVKGQYSLAASTSYPSFVDIISTRIGQGCVPLPDSPPLTTVFSRGLTVAAVSAPASTTEESRTVAALQISSGGSGGAGGRYATGIPAPQLRCAVPECPTWALGSGLSTPRLRLLVHVHEHKPGQLSLAAHSSGLLLVSCGSGDGLVKFWDCGRAAHINSGQSIVPVDTFVGQGTEDDDSIPDSSIEAFFDSSLTTEPTNSDDHFNTSFVRHCLPSRSLASYSVQHLPNPSDAKPSCRWLVWTEGESSVATLANHSAVHIVDSSVNCLRSIFPVQTPDYGMATCLTSPVFTSRGSDEGPFQSYVLCGTDRNLLVYSTTSGTIVGQDVRAKEPAWCLKQNRMHSLTTCLAVHSGHTWLAAGTIHGHVLIWDLRYQRAISHFSLPHNENDTVGITRLQLYDYHRANTHSTLICAATDHNNKVVLFDLDDLNPRRPSTTCVASTWTQAQTKPLFADESSSMSGHAVRSLLVLPPPAGPSSAGSMPSASTAVGTSAAIPNLVTGGNDARLRCWSFARPDTSSILVWAGNEESYRPFISFSEKMVDGVRVVAEEEKTAKDQLQRRHQTSLSTTSSIASASSISRSEGYIPLEVGEVTVGHTNAISDLALISQGPGHVFLVSAAMNGVIKFWK